MKLLTRGLTMSFSKKTFVVAGLAAAVSLAGCSSDNPDEGKSASKTAISGTAVDGYIAGATIYVDNNNNGRKNAGESSALTDKDGYFSTAKDGTDYCADDATSLQAIHCLKAAGIEDGAVVRTFGGYDLYTGEPFLGSLARRVTLVDGVVPNQMISPLTSMLVDIDDADQQQDLLNYFGLINDDLDVDFLDSAGYDANLVNSAIKLHKVVTLFSEVFSEQYEEFGVERSFPETPNAIIYKALADTLAENDTLNRVDLESIFSAAQLAISELYVNEDEDEDDDELDYPGNIDTTTRARAVDNAVAILNLVDNAIPSTTAFVDAKSRVIGVETIVKKMVDGDDADDDVNAAIAEVGNPSSQLYTEINAALAAGDVDFSELTDIDYTAPNYDDITVIGGGSFSNLVNKKLYVSFEDDGANGAGYIFFNSEEAASGGELKFCLRFDDGEDEVNFEESDGVLLSGTWLSLDDSKLILKLAGSLSVSLTDKGMKNDQHRYSLSYGGETRSWLSDDGLFEDLQSQSGDQPTDNATCKALLDTNND